MAPLTDDLEHSREEFLSRMSHEFRTPLNAVIGFSRVLESNRAGNQRPEDLELLRRVRASGEHLLRLIQDVLDHSSMRRGALPLELCDVDVATITTAVVDRHRNAAGAKGLKLRGILPAGAPTVRLDAVRFAQVVSHLVDNAVKFTTSGTIRVSLALDPVSRRPLRLTIADTGIGIPPERMDRIFEPFEQADGSMSRCFGGAGLGLPLARQLCEAMGCELDATSTVGEGSRFVIGFPQA
jgi:signal transduction histidine kinase